MTPWKGSAVCGNHPFIGGIKRGVRTEGEHRSRDCRRPAGHGRSPALWRECGNPACECPVFILSMEPVLPTGALDLSAGIVLSEAGSGFFDGDGADSKI